MDKKWAPLKLTAQKRGDKDCAICFNLLAQKECNLLSCSHMFHKHCLDSFETFDTSLSHQCPLCRCEDYGKITLIV